MIIINGKIVSPNSHSITISGNTTSGTGAAHIVNSYNSTTISNGVSSHYSSTITTDKNSGNVSISYGNSNNSSALQSNIKHVDVVLGNTSVLPSSIEQNSNGATTVINDKHGSTNINNVTANLTLTGNNTVLAGSNTVFANISDGNNTIIDTQANNTVFINGQTSSSAPAGNLVLSSQGAIGNGEGNIFYNQGRENAVINSLNESLTANLGKGSTTLNLANPSGSSINDIINIGLGNVIVNNFASNSFQSSNQYSNVNFYLGSNQTVIDKSYSGGNTVFSLNTGNTVVFTGVNLTNSNPLS